MHTQYKNCKIFYQTDELVTKTANSRGNSSRTQMGHKIFSANSRNLERQTHERRGLPIQYVLNLFYVIRFQLQIYLI